MIIEGFRDLADLEETKKNRASVHKQTVYICNQKRLSRLALVEEKKKKCREVATSKAARRVVTLARLLSEGQ